MRGGVVTGARNDSAVHCNEAVPSSNLGQATVSLKPNVLFKCQYNAFKLATIYSCALSNPYPFTTQDNLANLFGQTMFRVTAKYRVFHKSLRGFGGL
jgi:hypothetical protein